MTDIYIVAEGRGVIASDSNNTFCCNFPVNDCRPDPVIKSLKSGVPFTTIDLIESSGRVILHTKTSLSLTSAVKKLSTSPTESATRLTPATPSGPTTTAPPVSSIGASANQLHRSTYNDKSTETPSANPTTASALQSPDPHASQKQIHIGLGVGIPVGVALLISSTIYLWYRTRRRGKMFRMSSDQPVEGDRSEVDYRSMGFGPSELGEAERQTAPGELASESRNTVVKVFGASAASGPCELPTSRGDSLGG